MLDAIVFLGIQGSGKGTQAKLLACHTGYQHVNIGDLLREQVNLATPIGLQVQGIISQGDLVSDELVFKLVDESLDEDCRGIIFDGFPRTLPQALHLVEHYNVARVYYLDLKEHDALSRMAGRRVCSKCGENYHLQNHPPKIDNICDSCGGELILRTDDSPAAIAKRVQAFYEETFALTEFFEQRGILISISANAEIKEIESMILLDSFME